MLLRAILTSRSCTRIATASRRMTQLYPDNDGSNVGPTRRRFASSSAAATTATAARATGGGGDHKQKLETLLIIREIFPLSLLDDLKRVFTKVHYYPLLPFPDPNDKTARYPSTQEYKEADVILAVTVPPGLSDFEEQTPNLKLWQNLSAGYNHITDHAYFKSIPEQSTVQFASASGIHVSSIGEHTLAVTLMLFHKLGAQVVLGHQEQHWTPAQKTFGQGFVRTLRGQTVGIIGYGHIGREAARLAHSAGAKITTLTRSGTPSRLRGYLVPHTGDPSGTLPSTWFSSSTSSSRQEFFNTADVVIDTLPSSDATRKFVGEDELRWMRGDALLVNIGRGDTVDTEKLLEALTRDKAEGEESNATGSLRIGGAGLDVTDPEPLPDGHPFWRLPNVVLTPHSSGLSVDYFILAADLLRQNTERARAGKGVLNAYRGRSEEED